MKFQDGYLISTGEPMKHYIEEMLDVSYSIYAELNELLLRTPPRMATPALGRA